MGIVSNVVTRHQGKKAALAATVGVFLKILGSKLIRYDERLMKKEPNYNRLPLLLRAVHEVEDELSSIKDRDDEEAMGLLKKSLQKHFTRNFPPADAILKQIDAWVSSKKLPRL